eukprot:TRINITY_DN1239_c0_g1_i2.p1 TRINITY_DN1239_c0_g1~~TRINITY_DN1239_c0_g1_i2.p1  ORF type:complete len:278 (-),score=91.72 TRINITY_DN1239_c0_g1_i2:121-954(-)
MAAIPLPKSNSGKAPTTPVVVTTDDKKELSQEELEKVVGKLDVKEQDTKYYIDQKNQKVLITKEHCKQNSTIYFKNCHDGEYTIDPAAKCCKIMIENCSGCTLTFNGKITTNMIELWRCNSVKVEVNTKVLTFQVDLSKQVHLEFNNKQNFQSLVWAATHDLTLGYKSSPDKITTGLSHKKTEYPDLNEEIDQFIIRVIEGKLLEERIVRLSNGFPTTQREADEHDERERKNRERANEKLKKLVKSVEIKHNTGPKVGRNDNCTCGSGKKYKKCCGK